MRKLIFIRHAAAEDPEIAAREGRSEIERKLTSMGVKKFCGSVRGLKKVHADIELILHSPLVRAQQTAELLCNAYPRAEVRSDKELAPGMCFENLAALLDTLDFSEIALVGHEPDFGQAISAAINVSETAKINVKKGSAILVSFSDQICPGEGCLEWSITNEQLCSFDSNGKD